VVAAMGPELAFPDRDELRLVDVLQALADPVRLQLVRLLDETDGAVACGQIPLPVSKATASHHLKVLREAGVVTTERRGTYIYYDLAPDFARRWSGIGASLAGLVSLA
jgi:DNA-binding transcriptional ArsR family regulator